MFDSSIAKSHFNIFIWATMIILAASSCSSRGNNSNIDISTQYHTPTLEAPTNDVLDVLLPTNTPTPDRGEKTVEVLILTQVVADITDSSFNEPINTATHTSFVLCSPLASEKLDQLWEIISDPYNPPPPGREERHHGVDFSYYRRNERIGIEGEEIQSILPGIVVAKVEDRLPYGNMVIIETGNDSLPEALRSELKIEDGESLYHLYAHMKEEPRVALNDEVVCGQGIGIVGSTGYNVVNAHLHLETRIGPKNILFNTMAFYDTGATLLEMQNYKRWRTGGEFVHFDPMLLFTFYLDELLEK
jgi:murein DD-endopeptidase MepM/ murein hydrolase activator NlpD